MYVDAMLMFSDNQALTGTGAPSTSAIDLSGQKNSGLGEPLAVVVCADTGLAGGTPTFSVSVQFDDNSGFTTPTTVATSRSYSTLASGGKVVLPVPPNQDSERFMRLNYTLSGTTPTATVTSFISPLNLVQNDATYADAITIG